MKKVIIRLTKLILSLVLLLSMSVSVLAIGKNDSGKIKVSGIDKNYGGTVSAYEVMTVDYDYDKDGLNNPAYYWNDNVAKWIDSQTNDKFKSYIGDKSEVTDTFLNLSKDNNKSDLKDFVDALANHLKSTNISISMSKTINANPQSTENLSTTFELKMGGYLFIITDGVKIYSPGFAGVYPKHITENGKASWKLLDEEINVSVKGNEPTITKTADKKTVAIGDTVTFTLNVNVPQYPSHAFVKTFTIADTLPSGLTLENDSVSIKNGNDDITDQFDKTNNKFEYSVKNYDNLKNNIGNADTITLTYRTKVNSTAFDVNSLKNMAVLTYNSEPYTQAGNNKNKNDDEQLYTYGMKIKKETDKNDTVDYTQFTLFKVETDTDGDSDKKELKFKKYNNSEYYYISEDTDANTILEVDSNGEILIKGLNVGTYELKEIKAPTGYTIPKEPTTIIIDDKGTANNPDGIIDAFNIQGNNLKVNAPNENKIDDTNKNQVNFTIMNYKNELNLPTTGGIGTLIFTVVGILLMGGAVAIMIIVYKKRKISESC